MNTLYLDSNGFVKLFLNEQPAETARVDAALAQTSDLASSAITHAEVCGVFARQWQGGQITEEVYHELRSAFEADWQQVNVIAVSPGVSTLAADVLKSQPGLRAMDALHLASALSLRTQNPVRFLTFDARLNGAAARLMPEALT